MRGHLCTFYNTLLRHRYSRYCVGDHIKHNLQSRGVRAASSLVRVLAGKSSAAGGHSSDKNRKFRVAYYELLQAEKDNKKKHFHWEIYCENGSHSRPLSLYCSRCSTDRSQLLLKLLMFKFILLILLLLSLVLILYNVIIIIFILAAKIGGLGRYVRTKNLGGH